MTSGHPRCDDTGGEPPENAAQTDDHRQRVASTEDPGRGRQKKRGAALVLGLSNLALAIGYAVLLLAVIPSRHVWFQVTVAVVCLAYAAGGLGILIGRRRGLIVGAIGAAVMLGAGLAVIWGLLASAAYLYGIYGGFGRGAAIVLLLLVALVFELVCLLPTIQLWWLHRRLGSGRSRE